MPSDEEVPPEAVLHDVEIETPSYWLTHVAELQDLLTAPHAPTIRPVVAHALDTRPRKTLGWKTPNEAFEEHLRLLQQTGVASAG